MKYTYKDFATGKPKWTRGKFEGWQRGGSLNARYAIFRNPCGAVLVPEYCLTPETKAAIATPEAKIIGKCSCGADIRAVVDAFPYCRSCYAKMLISARPNRV